MRKLLLAGIIILSFVSCKSSTDTDGGTANVIMVEGPTFEDGGTLYFNYVGVVKNAGSAEATSVRVYISVYKSDGTLVENEWNYVNNPTLAPQATSDYAVKFVDDGGWIRAQIDKSKTTYEIKWN